MRMTLDRAMLLVAALALAIPAAAQFGHPLKGTWSGEWGPSKDKQTHLVLELHWDGKAITGTINPGPNAVRLRKATLDADTWNVHLEAEGKDASGKSVPYVLDGKLENIGAYNRVITGTWTQADLKGEVKLIRN
jgi:hypothetical protein